MDEGAAAASGQITSAAPVQRPASARSSANEVEAVLAAITAAADREVVEDLLPDLTQRCAIFERSALLKIDRLLRKRGLPQEQIRAWHAALNKVRAFGAGRRPKRRLPRRCSRRGLTRPPTADFGCLRSAGHPAVPRLSRARRSATLSPMSMPKR